MISKFWQILGLFFLTVEKFVQQNVIFVYQDRNIYWEASQLKLFSNSQQCNCKILQQQFYPTLIYIVEMKLHSTTWYVQEIKKKEIRKKKLDAVVSRCCCKRLARKLHPYFWLLSFLDQYFDGSFPQRVLPAVCYMGLGLFFSLREFFSPFFLVWQFSL